MRVHISHNANKKEIVEVPETEKTLKLLRTEKKEVVILEENKIFSVRLLKETDKELQVMINGKFAVLEIESDLEVLLKKMGITKKSGKSAKELKAPMPGLVKKILVNIGDEVEKNTPLLILEAMKMENIIKATGSGKIKEIVVGEGEAVEKNTLLIRFEI